MRVSSLTKQQTRRRILEAAHNLLSKQGFHATTTRHIALAAKIANGTLFNYFPSKEALIEALMAEAIEHAAANHVAQHRQGESLTEDLFALVMACVRRLEPHRSYVAAVLDSVLSPLARGANGIGDLRAGHLERVAELLTRHDVDPEASFVTLHLYWSLFVGVIAFWARDDSPNQEDTLVLLDRSLRLFVSSLVTKPTLSEVRHDA